MKGILAVLGICLPFFSGCQSGIQPTIALKAPAPETLTLTDGIYYGLDANGISIPFADFPEPYRNFYVEFCANCHSNNWTLQDDRDKSTFNTWQEIQSFGALSLLLMAQEGTMPIRPGKNIPPEILSTAIEYLAVGINSGPSKGSIAGISDPEISRISQKYCGACHGFLGTDLETADLRTYADWVKQKTNLLNTMNGGFLAIPMPERGTQEFELWKSNPAEKEKLIAWLSAGLKNE